jgi:PEP-CTERM motif
MRTRSTLSCAAVMLAICGAASGSSITYDFTVDATSGPLFGDTSSGRFTFDSSAIPSGGGTVYATGLLSALNFTWDGISYNANAANTGWLAFDSTGGLIFFIFGNRCTALSCEVNSPSTEWLASPGIGGFVYSANTDVLGFADVSYSLATSAPEPATLGLLGLGLAGLGLARHKRKNWIGSSSTRISWFLRRHT